MNTLWTDYLRLSLTWYAYVSGAYSFGSMRSREDAIRHLNGKKQADEQPDLAGVLQYLTSVSIVSPGDQPEHVVAFASVLRPDMIERCKRQVVKIYDIGATVTIVTMGANAPASLARQIDDRVTVIEWPIETTSEPAGWAQKFWRAYGCCEL